MSYKDEVDKLSQKASAKDCRPQWPIFFQRYFPELEGEKSPYPPMKGTA